MRWLLALAMTAVASTVSAQSWEVVNADANIYLAPSGNAPRRGTVALGARFPYQRPVAGALCEQGFVAIGTDAFVCSRHLVASVEPPSTQSLPVVAEGALLPHDYAFVAYDGARAFADPRDYWADDYFSSLGAGFGVVISDFVDVGGVRFARTLRGLYIESDALRMVRGSLFAGQMLAANVRYGFLPRAARLATTTVGARTFVELRSRSRSSYETNIGSIRVRDVVEVAATVRPSELPSDATWLDVDVRRQVLTFFRGDTPVFATLISSGRPGRTATPLGLHRIWVKLAFSDMDDLERSDAERNYAIERVPWVQYFEGSNGLHAAFWHDDFGRRKSHGCVNLSPRDARTVFGLTEPSLPPGWSAIFPKPDERTTWVYVHE